MAELSPAPPVRIAAASGNEQGTARDARPANDRKISKAAGAPASAPAVPDLDFDEKEEKHRLDERA